MGSFDPKYLRAEPPYPTLRFSTGLLGVRDRIESWRALFGHAICAADIEPVRGVDFNSDITLRVLPGLGLASGTCSGAQYARSGNLLVHDDLIFVVNHDGHDVANMFGREASIKGGEAVLLTMESAGVIVNKAPTRFTTMRMPRAAFADVPDLEAAMVNPISFDHPALRLLLNYISVLEDGDAVQTTQQQERVVANLQDLVAVAVGATGDPFERAKHRGIAAARLRKIKMDIRALIPFQNIDAATLAARHGVSPRYIQMLFEKNGETLSDFVVFERLAATHRLLRDPMHASRSISDIALSAGFNDVSYFNRTFRRQFNKTPTDLRVAG